MNPSPLKLQSKPQVITQRQYARPADVVRATGLSLSKVMAAIWSGDLEAYQKGRSWLVPVEAIDQWIRGNDQAA